LWGDDLNNDDIESFYVKDSSRFDYMPKGIENHFKNLKVLVVAYTSLKVLRQEDLKNFRKLQNLYFDNNLLEVIENDLFDSNPNIKYINFSSNQIKVVGLNAFDPLKSLVYLSIQNNVCINGKAENKDDLQDLLEEIRTECYSPEYDKSKQEPNSAVAFNIVKIQVVASIVSLLVLG
jgi:Leucine-rich repeat (LRR) protein